MCPPTWVRYSYPTKLLAASPPPPPLLLLRLLLRRRQQWRWLRLRQLLLIHLHQEKFKVQLSSSRYDLLRCTVVSLQYPHRRLLQRYQHLLSSGGH